MQHRLASPFLGVVLGCTSVWSACDEPDTTLSPEPGEELSGGATTVKDTTGEAFARPARNLSQERRGDFALGDHQFNRSWITAPASAEGSDGLGPLYHATSCSVCHYKDGRGAPPGPGEQARSLFLRISTGQTDAVTGEPFGDPTYGEQLAPLAILGIVPEGNVRIDYELFGDTFTDGEPFELRRPTYSVDTLGYGPLSEGAILAPRISRQLIGLGLLAAIEERDIIARADPEDADGDGISGRPNRVWDVRSGTRILGRFGWKATQPSLEQTVARAFHADIGVSSELFPNQNCTPAQTACAAAPTGGDHELDSSKLSRITFYMHTLAVPARRGVDAPEVLAGRELFEASGCASCHVRRAQTGTLPDYPELSNQAIWPYTDLLLHDMGAGLADGMPEYDADGREWRTPPLWGIGLVEAVNDHTFFLHDGRARSLSEAILWHGGEALVAREKFRSMPASERAQLLAFLESL